MSECLKIKYFYLVMTLEEKNRQLSFPGGFFCYHFVQFRLLNQANHCCLWEGNAGRIKRL